MFLADRPLHDKSPYPLSRIQQFELRYKSIRPLLAGVPFYLSIFLVPDTQSFDSQSIKPLCKNQNQASVKLL